MEEAETCGWAGPVDDLTLIITNLKLPCVSEYYTIALYNRPCGPLILKPVFWFNCAISAPLDATRLYDFSPHRIFLWATKTLAGERPFRRAAEGRGNTRYHVRDTEKGVRKTNASDTPEMGAHERQDEIISSSSHAATLSCGMQAPRARLEVSFLSGCYRPATSFRFLKGCQTQS